jgi:hypothetical protein
MENKKYLLIPIKEIQDRIIKLQKNLAESFKK